MESNLQEVPAKWGNVKLLVGGEQIVAVEQDGLSVKVGDKVRVVADAYGFVGSGLKYAGEGVIESLKDDESGAFYGVRTMLDEFGYFKKDRILFE